MTFEGIVSFTGHVCKHLELRFSVNRNHYYFQSDYFVSAGVLEC